VVFVAGIDEAGYGPFVGPFVVGYSLFRAPDLETDLWPILEPAALRKPPRNDRRLWINDSKKVHSGKHGRARLERSIAACQASLGDEAMRFADYVRSAPAGPSKWLEATPWLADDGSELCPSADHGRARLDAATLGRALERGGCSLHDVGCRMVPVGEWNQWIAQTGNKSETLFQVTMEVVRHILTRTGRSPLRIELDQHGARRHYAPRLQQALQPDRIERHGETRAGSAYTLHFAERAVQFRFSEKADEQMAQVALASMAAKQGREAAMDRFNAWWAERMPELKPTKGYGVDGKRWLAEAERAGADVFVEHQLLKRSR